MHNPPHPGETLQELCLKELCLTITSAAKSLNMTRTALSEIINGKRGVSPKVAVKFAKTFGGSAEVWLKMQSNYDLWQCLKVYKADDVETLHG